MADNRAYVQGQSWYLAGSGITSSATSITLSSMKYPDNETNVVTADVGAKFYLTLEPETSREENISATTITQNANGTATLTGVVRGLGLKAPYTADAANQYAHAGGSLVRITNSAPFYNDFANKENNETISQVWTFSSTNRPALAADVDTLVDTEFPTYGQLARSVIAGSVPATTTDAGIVKIATDAQIAAGTGTSGSYSLVPNGASFTNTAAATKGVVSKSNAKIDDGWLGLTTAGDTVYSDGTDLQRLAIGTSGLYMRSTGSAPSWGGANLDEANTFFGITNITGAQANTLVGGSTSNAGSLHWHPRSFSFCVPFNETNAVAQNVTVASGFSDATTKSVAVAIMVDDTGSTNFYEGFHDFKYTSDVGGAFYNDIHSNPGSALAAGAAATEAGAVTITTHRWTADNNQIRKDGTAVTFSGTTRLGALGFDPTNSYLLVLYSTTKIAKFSGVSGTTITNLASDVTLDTAVSTGKGFIYDNTNSRYICLDTTGNVVRRFDSAGTTIDTAAYTFDDTNAVGLAISEGRVYVVIAVESHASASTAISEVMIDFLPTSMTI